MNNCFIHNTDQIQKHYEYLSIENEHHLFFCRSREACPLCGEIAVLYYVEDRLFNLRLQIPKNHYASLVETFNGWVSETLYEEFSKGSYLLTKDELSFWKEPTNISTQEWIVVVSKDCGKEVVEITHAGERFKDLQDILDYKVENFYADFNSGNHRVNIRA